VVGHGGTLFVQEAGYGVAEIGIGDPVCRICGAGQVAALDLVLSLGAGFNPGQLMFDGEIDGAVITAFKMQKIALSVDSGRAVSFILRLAHILDCRLLTCQRIIFLSSRPLLFILGEN